MPLYLDKGLDAALNYILLNADRMYICSAEPTTFLEAQSTFRLGVKLNPSFVGPINGAVDGRRIQIDNFSDGLWEITGDGTHYALVDEGAGELLVVEALSTAPEAGVALDSFTITSPVSITLRDAA